MTRIATRAWPPRWLWFLVLPKILLLLLVPSAPVEGQVAGATVSGRVLSALGGPVPAALVRLVGADTLETRADEAGRFSFSGLAPGPWIVHAGLAGYAPDVAFVDIEPGEAGLASLVLPEPRGLLAGWPDLLPDSAGIRTAAGLVHAVLGDPDLVRLVADAWPRDSAGDTVRVWAPWLADEVTAESPGGLNLRASSECPGCAPDLNPTRHTDQFYVGGSPHLTLGVVPIGDRGLQFCARFVGHGWEARTGNCTSPVQRRTLTYWERGPNDWVRVPCLGGGDLGCEGAGG